MSHHINVDEFFSHMFERIRLEVGGRRREERMVNRFNGSDA